MKSERQLSNTNMVEKIEYFIKEVIRMTMKHIEMHSTSLAINDLQITTPIREGLKWKRFTTPNIGVGVKQRAPSHVVGSWPCKLLKLLWKNVGSFL